MAVGDIGAAVIDTLVLETGTGSDVAEIDITHLTGNLFVAVYNMVAVSDAFMKTFTVDNDGNFSAVLDTETLNGGGDALPKVTKVAEGMVAVYVRNIRTFPIDSDGIIGTQVGAITPPAGGAASDGHLLKTHHANDLFVCVYERFTPIEADIMTFTINAAGEVSAILDIINIETRGNTPDIAHAIGDVYAIALENSNTDDVQIETVTIDSDGNISAQIDTRVILAEGARPSIATDDNGTIIVSYEAGATLNAGRIQTLNIQADGTVDPVLDTVIRGDLNGSQVKKIGPSQYLVASTGNLITYSVDGSGNLAVIDSLGSLSQLDDLPEAAYLPFSGNIWAIAYADDGGDEAQVFSISLVADLDPSAQVSAAVGMQQREILL